MIWYNSKNELMNSIKDNFNNKLFISRDIGDKNAKQFAHFTTYNEYIQYLNNNKHTNLYEILYEDSFTPVYMYFDLDRTLCTDTDIDIIDNYENYCSLILDRFIYNLNIFIKQYYKSEDIKFIIGNNIQVSYTKLNNLKPKISLHIKINIIMKNILQMKKFTFNFNNFLLSNKYTNDEDRNLFYYYKSKNKNSTEQIYESIIDNSVYTNFRSFRILYSSKLTKNLPLLPFENSSEDIKDHLLNNHPENPQICININLDIDKVLLIDADFQKIKNTTLSKPKYTKIITKTNNSNGTINSQLLSNIQNLLETNSDIKNYLQLNPDFKYSKYITECIYRFCINPENNIVCPYANRIHTNNRSYFDYYKNNNILQYGCFNDSCCNTNKLLSFSVNNSFDALSKLNELYIKNTIHCKDNLIEWNEKYNNINMNKYPLKPLVAIGANMGVGKTNELINNFIKINCSDPNTKCLFITYQILLSKKYSEELEDLGFINYLDRKDTRKIIDNKVIICLDSLWKVNTMNFNYIFIDEAMSVLLHFNSPLIKDINFLSLKFELLLLQAKHIYLLDACIDNTIVYNMVEYLEDKKNIKCYWIKNEYVKETNRNAVITINNNNTYKSLLEKNALDYIINNLTEGKNIVVSSSTKAFTELLKYKLESEYPDIKYIVYNSSTDTLTLQKHSINPNDIWTQYQCVIYSPTISAGISFTNLHFDELVCYIENSLYTPTVDNTLQQMFRVRQLKNGKMNLFINNILKFSFEDYPITEGQIEYWLDTHTAEINAYFPNDSLNITKSVNLKYHNTTDIVFDNTLMSYQTMKSILYNKNKSLHFYIDILTNTLEKDYNIPFEIKLFTASKDKIDNANEIMKEYKAKLKKVIEFDTKFLINSEQFDILCQKQFRESLTEYEKQMKYTYDVAINIWNFRDIRNVSKEFFDNYIGHYSQSSKILDKYYVMLRNYELKNTLEENKQIYMSKIRELIDEHKDFNFRLLQINKKRFYEKLIEGQYLLDFINPEKKIEVNRKEFNCSIDKYLKNLNEDWYKKIRDLYDLSHNKKYNKLKEIDNYKGKLLIVKKILTDTFNIDICIKNRNISKLYFSFNNWNSFNIKYKIDKIEENYLFK